MPAPRAKLEPQKERIVTGNPRSAILDPEIVAQLAYSYWEARGYEGGSPEEDWLRAEEELYGRTAQAA